MISTKYSTLEALKGFLPYNYRKIISEKFNNRFSGSYISKVVAGTRNNVAILNATIELARETRDEYDLINEQINNLSEEHEPIEQN